MADAGDSKSPALYGCEGSTPSSGTILLRSPSLTLDRATEDWSLSRRARAEEDALRSLGEGGQPEEESRTLNSHFPKAGMKIRRVLTELVRFQEVGEMPRMSETERQELEKARKNTKT